MNENETGIPAEQEAPDAVDTEAIRRKLKSLLGSQQELPIAQLIIEAVLAAFRKGNDDD